MIEALIFDLDGVLIDSEQIWDQVRRELVSDVGGRWLPDATQVMQGMSSVEWSAYLHDALKVPLNPEEINKEVVARIIDRYRKHLPLLPGAVQAVGRMRERFPLGLASSSNREVIRVVLEQAELDDAFAVVVSSEEVARGKPAPDVYLEAASRMGWETSQCGVVEDSANGIRSGVAAGMIVVAIPNPHFPPPNDVLSMARVVIKEIGDLDVRLLASQ